MTGMSRARARAPAWTAVRLRFQSDRQSEAAAPRTPGERPAAPSPATPTSPARPAARGAGGRRRSAGRSPAGIDPGSSPATARRAPPIASAGSPGRPGSRDTPQREHEQRDPAGHAEPEPPVEEHQDRRRRDQQRPPRQPRTPGRAGAAAAPAAGPARRAGPAARRGATRSSAVPSRSTRLAACGSFEIGPAHRLRPNKVSILLAERRPREPGHRSEENGPSIRTGPGPLAFPDAGSRSTGL